MRSSEGGKSPEEHTYKKFLRIIYDAGGGIDLTELRDKVISSGLFEEKTFNPMLIEFKRIGLVGFDYYTYNIDDPSNLRLVAILEKELEVGYKILDYLILTNDALDKANRSEGMDRLVEVAELYEGDEDFKEDLKRLSEQPKFRIYLTEKGRMELGDYR